MTGHSGLEYGRLTALVRDVTESSLVPSHLSYYLAALSILAVLTVDPSRALVAAPDSVPGSSPARVGQYPITENYLIINIPEMVTPINN